MTSLNFPTSHTTNPADSKTQTMFNRFSVTACCVVLIGFLLRLWVCLHTAIVNPDGLLYIHQAMSLYYRDWKSLKACGLHFISSYPLMIAGGYALFHIGWFFMSAGVLAVIHPPKRASSQKWLLLTASLCFLLAAWARIEAILYIGVTLLYLAFFASNRKTSHILFFLAPLAAVALLSIGGLAVSRVSFSDLFREHDLLPNLTGPIIQYGKLTASLKNLQWSSSYPGMKFFLPEARNTVWLIAFGTVLNRFLEAFFYPYALLYIIGLSGIFAKMRSDSRLIYLSLLAGFGLMLMYMHTLQAWMLYYRFFGMIIIPGVVFCAFGIEKLLNGISSALHGRQRAAFCLVFLVILAVSLPKNIKAPDPDEAVFPKIGDVIYQHSHGSPNVLVATSCKTQRVISFYANIRTPGIIPCPLNTTGCWESFPDNPQQFYDLLRQRHIHYVLWEENNWPPHRFSFSNPSLAGKYIPIGEWFQKDTGKMILYETADGKPQK